MNARELAERSLARTRAELGDNDLWVFAYASLIWQPEFDAVEHRPAVVHGFHRAFQMHSHLHRGTPERPGLVFALLAGGSCRGVAFRIARDHVDRELDRLWAREMHTGVYDPRWLRCRTPSGSLQALAFTLHHTSPSYAGTICDETLVGILREACGGRGSTLDYLLHTARTLRERGIRDRKVERLVSLARRNALA